MSLATASCDLWQNEQRSTSSEPVLVLTEKLLHAARSQLGFYVPELNFRFALIREGAVLLLRKTALSTIGGSARESLNIGFLCKTYSITLSARCSATIVQDQVQLWTQGGNGVLIARLLLPCRDLICA